MKTIYLVSGASGHLGSTLIKILKEKKNRIRALILPGEEAYTDKDTEIFIGDVTELGSLERFFEHETDEELILFHCAGIVSVSSKENPMLYKVNVEGTRNMLEMALKYKVKKVVHVSSVHAFVYQDEGEICEPDGFYPDRLGDPYGRSKALATNLCLEYVKKGLDISIVNPTSIYGPGDKRKNNPSVISIWMLYKVRVPIGLEGGFDFVDVRDVAQGMIDCAYKGRKGECYILSGYYLSANDLINEVNQICGRKKIKGAVPYKVVKPFAPLMEKITGLFIARPPITPAALSIFNTNGHFSHDKASRELGYQARRPEETLRDMIEEFKAEEKI